MTKSYIYLRHHCKLCGKDGPHKFQQDINDVWFYRCCNCGFQGVDKRLTEQVLKDQHRGIDKNTFIIRKGGNA